MSIVCRYQAGAGQSVPPRATDAASASTSQGADLGGPGAGATGHAEGSKAPQQQAHSSAALAAPALEPHMQMTNGTTAAPAGASAEQLPPAQPGGADVSMADDVSAAGDVGEGVMQRSGHEILPAVYLQSVLDSWQAEPQVPAAPRAEPLLGVALGEDQGDFEIYEASEAEPDVDRAGPAAGDSGSDEGGQTNGEILAATLLQLRHTTKLMGTVNWHRLAKLTVLEQVLWVCRRGRSERRVT